MIYFFDTSALQHRYIDGPKARGIRWMISNARNQCLISDLTVLEIASALSNYCRQKHVSLKEYRRMDQKFWKDIASLRVEVIPTGKKEYIRARDLLRFAGVLKGRKISSGDALIAAACLEYALAQDTRVSFCLEDKKLYKVLRDVSAYSKAVDFHYIGP